MTQSEREKGKWEADGRVFRILDSRGSPYFVEVSISPAGMVDIEASSVPFLTLDQGIELGEAIIKLAKQAKQEGK